MKRVVLVGSSGSGKSTLARELGLKLQLPIVHLDRHFWHPGWVGTPHSVWERKVRDMVRGPEWIIDGNYRSTLDIRLEAADTVIFLDLPRWICAWRACKRRLQYINRQRPDMADGCQESLLDPRFPQFLRWVLDYPNRARPDVIQRLNDLKRDTRVVWLRSPAEVRRFLTNPRQVHIRITRVDEFYEYFARNNK